MKRNRQPSGMVKLRLIHAELSTTAMLYKNGRVVAETTLDPLVKKNDPQVLDFVRQYHHQPDPENKHGRKARRTGKSKQLSKQGRRRRAHLRTTRTR